MASPWSRRQRGRPPYPLLTPAEERVLAHLRRGLTNAEIAVRLGVSLDAVKYHVSNMLGKLGLQNREQLAAWREPSRPRRMWAGIPAVVKIGLVTAAGVAVVAVVHAFATRTEPESETLFQGLVTVGFDGAPANGPSRNAHLSTDGRYLVFESDASNLVKDDRNGGTDVFRFDRRERKLQLLTDLAPGSASAVSSSGPSVSANGDVVAFIVAGANPFFGGIRLWENGTSGLRNFSDVPTLVASVSPRGDLVAAVQLEQWAAQTLAALEVRDVRSGDTVWRTPLEPALDAGTPGFSSDGRWLVFAASSVPEARCEPLLREVLIGDSVNALPVARPFVHVFLTGETWCPSITPTDGTVIVDFGIAAVSGDAAAFAFMSGETVAGSGGTRILGAGLVMVSLATGEVLGTLASADLSFCCGGPPAIAGRTLVWGPYRKAGLDYFDPFPDALPATVVTPGRFAPGTAKYFGPALSGDSRSLAYGVEGHDIQTGATLGDLYVFYR